ncbi:hypothetical protein NSA29_11980 [Staphylococcus warneri]|uniref:hypothetical protein n=1 Tax=Staphylococcus warneri TaxID=1292 RepID=UPI00214ABA69|nr:hypothetical protein [Staphylococcus warneri]MCR1798253.1 hypothetical protein [Staphylococcus warneri]
MKRLLLLCLTIVLIVSLAACGLGEPERQKKTTKKGQMKIGEMMQENKRHVWFLGVHTNTEEIDGNTKISRIIVTKNGKMKVYDLQNVTKSTMNDYAKMSDDEIIKNAKKEDKKRFNFVQNKLIHLTDGEIKEAKNYIKKGDDYEPAATMENDSVVYGYAYYQDDGKAKPEESLKKLKKYKSDLESNKYQEPKSRKVDLNFAENDLSMTIARQFKFPSSAVAHPPYADEDFSKLKVEQALQPKSYNGTKYAGVGEDGDKEPEEKDFLILTTKVNDKVKNVLIDEKDDPAIKANKPKEDN